MKNSWWKRIKSKANVVKSTLCQNREILKRMTMKSEPADVSFLPPRNPKRDFYWNIVSWKCCETWNSICEFIETKFKFKLWWNKFSYHEQICLQYLFKIDHIFHLIMKFMLVHHFSNIFGMWGILFFFFLNFKYLSLTRNSWLLKMSRCLKSNMEDWCLLTTLLKILLQSIISLSF